MPGMPLSRAFCISTAFISAGVSEGLRCNRRAAVPETIGVAIDVPLNDLYPEESQSWQSPVGTELITLTPTALTSGFVLLSFVGPREENQAISSSSSTAPIVVTLKADAGMPTVWLPHPPEFPAATMTEIP